MNWQAAALYYYLFGLIWLISGFAIGWLRVHGSTPLAMTLWTLAMAAVWPLLLGKMVIDVCRGNRFTDF